MKGLKLTFFLFIVSSGLRVNGQFIKFYGGLNQKTNTTLYQTDYIPYSTYTDIIQTKLDPTLGVSLSVLYQHSSRWKSGLSSSLDFLTIHLHTNSSSLEKNLYEDNNRQSFYSLYYVYSLSSEYLIFSRRLFGLGLRFGVNEHFPSNQLLKESLKNPNLDAQYRTEFISGLRNFRSFEIGTLLETLNGSAGISFTYQRSFSKLFHPNYKYFSAYSLGLRINFFNLDKEKIGTQSNPAEGLLIKKKQGFKVGLRMSTVPFSLKKTTGKRQGYYNLDGNILYHDGDLESSRYDGYSPVYPTIFGVQQLNRFFGIELGINWRGYNFRGNKTTIYADTTIIEEDGNYENHFSLQAVTIFKIFEKNNFKINFNVGILGNMRLNNYEESGNRIQNYLVSLAGIEIKQKNIGLRASYLKNLGGPIFTELNTFGEYTEKNFRSLEFSISYDLFSIKKFSGN